jgi:hypothetical protein
VVQSNLDITFEPTVYMTVKEVSNYFKIGANSAHKFAQIGLKEGFVFKNGNKYIFDAKKFETYLFQKTKQQLS